MAGKVITLNPAHGAERAVSPTVLPSSIVVQRIRFLKDRDGPGVVVREFSDPYPRIALADGLEIADFHAVEQSTERTDDLIFVFVAAGSITPYEWQKKVEEWISSASPEEPLIDVTAHSDRIWWRHGRAVVMGSPERLHELRAALTDFAFHEAELRRLEREVEQALVAGDHDVALTRQVTRRDMGRWENVNEITEKVCRFRMRYVRLEPRLEKAPLTLEGPARRLYSELAVQADIADRLRYLDDKLEVLEDLYELANDRLSEYSYFRREYRLEMAIFLILCVEVLVMLAEIGMLSH